MKKILYSLAIIAVLGLIVVGISISAPSIPKSTLQPVAYNPSANAIATIAIQSISHTINTASIFAALSNTVTWATASYPTDAGVNVNLIQKIADSPAKYILVRQLATDFPDNGQYSWVSNDDETGPNLYVEVTCSNDPSLNLTEGCQVASAPLAVN